MSTDTLDLPEYEAIEPSTTFERLVVARLEALEAENRELRALVEDQKEEISSLRGETAKERAFDRRRIFKLEDTRCTVSATTANAHINRLLEQMIRFGSRQVTVMEAAHLIGVSKDHMKKIKQHLADDSRFAVVKDPHHKQRHLIRLL